MIHNTAIISPKAEIGKNVQIGPYCIIGEKVRIADNVTLKSHIVIEGRTTIGEGTTIHPFASLSYPQTLKYLGEDSEIIIGKNNIIREYVTIQHGTKEDRMITSIGDNCLLMVGVHVAHNCKVGNNVIMANYVNLAGHVEVGDFAIIGGLSAVQQYVKIGAHSMIGGLSGVDTNLVPFGLAANERANLEGLNLVGMNRRGFNKSQSLEANRLIKDLFMNNSEELFYKQIDEAQANYPDNKVIQEIIDFIQQNKSKRFCKFK